MDTQVTYNVSDGPKKYITFWRAARTVGVTFNSSIPEPPDVFGEYIGQTGGLDPDDALLLAEHLIEWAAELKE